MRVSPSSERRATSGIACSPASTRSARTPASKPSKKTPSYAWAAGAARTRSESSEMTPSVPSEPMTSARKSGPAAVAGNGARSSAPAGARMRSPTTIFAIAPYPLDACPAERVAAQPPSETNSYDCG